jgi:outer membrane receptor for ferrienterochelin and colicins
MPDALIRISPLDEKKRKTKALAGLTNPNGVMEYAYTEPVIINISYLGFTSIFDTVTKAEHKVYEITPISKDIHDVVVTGQYGYNSAKKSVYEVKIITNDMLRSKGANNLREALQNELSIDLGQDQVFGSTLGINGISGEGVKIMVDGVPVVGRLDGKLDLSQINVNNIDHIEIVEGPLSVMYGTDAMGGVVNIITKNFQKDKINLNLKAYYESVGQYNVELNGGFAFKKSQVYISAGRNFFNGYTTLDSVKRYKEWKPKEQYFADAKYVYTGNRFRFSVSGSFFRELMLDRSAPIRTLSYTNGDTAWTYTGLDGHYLTYRPRASASFMYRFKEGYQLEALLAYSGFIRYTTAYSKDLITLKEQIVNDPSQQDTTRDHQITFRAAYNMPAWRNRLNFQFGVDINQEFVTETTLKDKKQQLGDYAAFGSIKLTLVEGLDIQPAIRFSYNTKFQVPLIPSLNVRYN